jgi:hypothetical protein
MKPVVELVDVVETLGSPDAVAAVEVLVDVVPPTESPATVVVLVDVVDAPPD